MSPEVLIFFFFPFSAGKCMARQIIKAEHLVVDKSDEYR